MQDELLRIVEERLAADQGGQPGVVAPRVTIHRFMPAETGDRNPMLSDRRKIDVIADESQRSQYDFIDGFARSASTERPVDLARSRAGPIRAAASGRELKDHRRVIAELQHLRWVRVDVACLQKRCRSRVAEGVVELIVGVLVAEP